MSLDWTESYHAFYSGIDILFSSIVPEDKVIIKMQDGTAKILDLE